MGRTAFMKATSPPNFIEIHQSVWPKSRNKQASKQADKNPPIPSTLGVEPRPCSLRSLGQQKSQNRGSGNPIQRDLGNLSLRPLKVLSVPTRFPKTRLKKMQ